MKSSRNDDLSKIFPFATEFIAQPPARARFVSPVRACTSARTWKKASSYIACIEAAIALCRSCTASSLLRGGPSRFASSAEKTVPMEGEPSSHTIETPSE